jgi:signal transduction histidine kinase/CheY-like chemotaxis protein
MTDDPADVGRADPAGPAPAVADLAPLAVCVVDPETLVILDVSLRDGTLAGYSPADLVGRNERRLWPAEPELRAEAEAALAEARASGFARRRGVPYRAASGQVVRLDSTRQVVEARGRRYEVVVLADPGGAIADSPAPAAAPARPAGMARSQTMAVCGRLAAGIAHEFNNLLTVITGGAETVLHRLGPADPLRGQVDRIRLAADRAAGLVRRLMAVGGRQVLQPRVVELNGLVAKVAEALQGDLGQDLELSVLPSLRPVRVHVDEEQVGQVLRSLASHARDTRLGRRRLVIEAAIVTLDGIDAIEAELEPGSYGAVSVTDSRRLLDSTVQTRLFEPFFAVGDARPGLDLAAAYGIVRQSGGGVRVTSHAEQGTRFILYLPVADTASEAPAEPSGRVAPAAATETILLVEDEQDVLDIARELLEAAGYTVLAAHAPGEALHVATHHQGPIHLLVTDVVMPGMNGPELAARVARGRPEIRVLYMSGYADAVPAFGAALAAGAGFIQKPFGAVALARKAREVLDGVRRPIAAAARPPVDSAGTPVKVVVRFANGAIVKGTTLDFYPGKPTFHLQATGESDAPTVSVHVADLKAVFFVRDLSGNPDYQERKEFPEDSRPPGRRIEVTFVDGEALVGYTLGYDPARPGFFLFPADPQSNNLRVFAVTAAVRRVRYL